MDGIDAGFGWVGDKAGGALEEYPLWQSLVVNGIVAGLASPVQYAV